jgi:hypothetical protein
MLPKVFDQAKALKSLDGKPLAVLSADVGEQRGWAAAQAKLEQLSRNNVHRTTHGATHAALLEDQRFAAVTSRTIADVVRSARQVGAEAGDLGPHATEDADTPRRVVGLSSRNREEIANAALRIRKPER